MAGREAQPNVDFHKGRVLAWDAIAGTNTVRVLGADMPNLPVVPNVDVGVLRRDDDVAVLRVRNTYYVLGRLTGPAGAVRGNVPVSQRAAALVSTTSAAFVDLTGGPSVDVYIGSSKRCTVEVSAVVVGRDCTAYAGVDISGASVIGPAARWSVGAGVSVPGVSNAEGSASSSRVITLTDADGLTEGWHTFRMRYQCVGSAGTRQASFSDREISVRPF